LRLVLQKLLKKCYHGVVVGVPLPLGTDDWLPVIMAVESLENDRGTVNLTIRSTKERSNKVD
jgi:hypothetical protein